MEIKTPPKIYAYAYHIYSAWYNGSYTMATKPIKFLELYYTMTHSSYTMIIYHDGLANENSCIAIPHDLVFNTKKTFFRHFLPRPPDRF